VHYAIASLSPPTVKHTSPARVLGLHHDPVSSCSTQCPYKSRLSQMLFAITLKLFTNIHQIRHVNTIINKLNKLKMNKAPGIDSVGSRILIE